MPPAFQCARIGVNASLATRIDSEPDLEPALARLGLTRSIGLVLSGGAGGMDSNHAIAPVHRFFFEVLAPLAESLSATIIDGGTDTGVMRLIGQARAKIGATFPLLGVAAAGTVAIPASLASSNANTQLDPHHSHFLIVPGQCWGDESPWIARAATLLSSGFRSLTVVVNGGEITLRDVASSIREGRRVLVLSGSGRCADRLAQALQHGGEEAQIRALLASGMIESLQIDQNPLQLMRALASRLID